MLLNSCVLLDSHSDPSDGDPLHQPRSLGIAKRRTRVRRSLLLHSDVREEPSSNSTRIAESHGRQSLGQSKQRVEVTGSCLLLNPNSLITRYFSILCLVLRAVNVPSIRKYFIKKRMFFVTVYNPETTTKTADVPVERRVAKWNQILDPL